MTNFKLIAVLTVITAFINVSGQMKHINLYNSFQTKQQINLSEIAYSVEYVKLETNPFCRCGPQVRVYCNEKYIITVSVNNIFVFDRKTGAFINEIGKSDQIFSTYYVIPFDERRSIITFKSAANTIVEFTLMNDFLQEIQLPVEHGNSVYWKNENYVQFISNITGKENRRLIIFNADNTVFNVFRNENRFVKTIKTNYHSNKEGGFYWFNDNLYFKETFIDTIYQITEQKLIPKYCFNGGLHGLKYSMKGSLDLRSKHQYFFISNIFETENYLFFNVEYGLKVHSGIYFKKKDNCKISDFCLINRFGFVNDIDNFIPLHFSSVNNNNELVGFCTPDEIEKWNKGNKIIVPDNNIYHVFEIHKDDNPVVIIAKLK